MPYFTISIMKVSNNGYICFGYCPKNQRVSLLPTSSVPLVAALWEDFDFRNSAFRSSGTVFYRTSNDSLLLKAMAARIAQENPDLRDFRPSLSVIVTWFEAFLFSGMFSDTRVSLTTEGQQASNSRPL